MRKKLTVRDIEIVRWLGRHRLATAEQVMRRFDMQRSKAYERLAVVAGAGLARHEEGVRSPRVYLATRYGLRVAGIDLRPATLSLAGFEHDMRVVDVAIAMERNGMVLSERELRRRDRGTSKPTYRLESFGGRPDQRFHWPDLVLELPDRRLIAIEVELSIKTARRLGAKLSAYGRSAYWMVSYVVGTEGIGRAIRKQAREHYVDKVDVRSIESITESQRRQSGWWP